VKPISTIVTSRRWKKENPVILSLHIGIRGFSHPPLIHQYFSPTLVFSSAVKRTIQMCFQDQLELATGNRDHHLSADYVPLHVGIGLIFKPVERYWLTGSCDAGRCL
jgi:hypothetical protein